MLGPAPDMAHTMSVGGLHAGYVTGPRHAHSTCRTFRNVSLHSRLTTLPSLRAHYMQQQRHETGGRARRHRHKSTRCQQSSNNNGNGATANKEPENLVIIGSGPAGYTAAIYAARANLKPLVFEGFQAGGVRGGQLMTTTEVENFPGFPDGITGPDLMDKMRAQAERWGSELLTEDVEHVDLSVRPFSIRTSETEVKAHSIIIATGATAKRLGIPSEEKFWSNGISACAICDGASYSFRNKELAVVGGGDTAVEEAIYLTKYASKVHLLARGSKLRASRAMQDRVLAHDKVDVHFNTTVDDAYPDGKGALDGLHTKDTESGESGKLPVKGLFYGIGHQPNSGIVAGQIDLDDKGYIKVQHGVQTNVEGVYAAGDIFDVEWRQAITAAGSGCMAALAAERYLASNDLAREYHSKEQDEAKDLQPEEKQKAAAEADFDVNQDKHRGQFALRKLYHESDRVLVVLYTSPTCGPCRTLKPIFSKVVDEYDKKVHLVEIDIEEDPKIAEAAGVQSTPTIQMFKDKERVQHLPGVKMKSDYRKFINDALGEKAKVPA